MRHCLCLFLRMVVRQFVEECIRRGLKVNAGKSKVIILNGEERLKCEVHVDRVHLEHVSEFKYLGSVLDELDTNGAEGCRKVAGAINSLVNARDLQPECATLA